MPLMNVPLKFRCLSTFIPMNGISCRRLEINGHQEKKHSPIAYHKLLHCGRLSSMFQNLLNYLIRLINQMVKRYY